MSRLYKLRAAIRAVLVADEAKLKLYWAKHELQQESFKAFRSGPNYRRIISATIRMKFWGVIAK